MAKKKRELTPEEALRQGLDSLERGGPAEGWVCQEVLSLTGKPTLTEILNALHKHLHIWPRDFSEDRVRKMRLALGAAHHLVRLTEEEGDEHILAPQEGE